MGRRPRPKWPRNSSDPSSSSLDQARRSPSSIRPEKLGAKCQIIGLPHTKIIYVESFARTNSLSLSGKILRGFVDVFVVQWPEAAGPEANVSLNDRNVPASDRDNKVVYRGWLV